MEVELVKKCEYYKKLLVEELYFAELLQLHYGECSVIGKINCEHPNDYYLENIKIPSLETEYRLPEASIRIRIIDNLINGGTLQTGKIAEIFGTAVLYDKVCLKKNDFPISSQQLQLQFDEFVRNAGEKDSSDISIDQLKKEFNDKSLIRYEPAIQIQFFNLTDSGDELVECNLQIRMLCDEQDTV